MKLLALSIALVIGVLVFLTIIDHESFEQHCRNLGGRAVISKTTYLCAKG